MIAYELLRYPLGNFQVSIVLKMMDQSRTHRKNLLFGVGHAFAVHLGIGDLFEVVAVNAYAKALGNHLIGHGKVDMNRLTRPGIIGI